MRIKPSAPVRSLTVSLHKLGLLTLLMLVGVVLLSPATQAADPEATSLFNGKDLSGWTPFIWDRFAGKEDTKSPASTFWKVDEGVLICKGRPTGYLRTKQEYENYTLSFEWRWPADGNGGNSGVLVHTTTPNVLGQWPRSVEVQLFRRNAGDFWVIPAETKVTVENQAERQRGRRILNLTNDSEKPFGEWNQMQITCRGDEIIVKVNDELVNHGTKCSISRGAICLQSEGAEIHFRNIVLQPLKPAPK